MLFVTTKLNYERCFEWKQIIIKLLQCKGSGYSYSEIETCYKHGIVYKVSYLTILWSKHRTTLHMSAHILLQLLKIYGIALNIL